MSKYVCEINGYGNGEIVAPRFNPDGTILDGMIVYLDENAKAHDVINNSFALLPVSWDDWTVENAPTAAHLYVDSTRYSNPFEIAKELANAERYRQALIKQRQTEPGETQPVDEPGAKPETEGNAPEAPPAPDLAEPPKEEEFDPRDTDKDGKVSKAEKKAGKAEKEK